MNRQPILIASVALVVVAVGLSGAVVADPAPVAASDNTTVNNSSFLTDPVHPSVEHGLGDRGAYQQTTGSDTVSVVVEAAPDRGAEAMAVVSDYGRVEARHDHFIQLAVPRSDIPVLAEDPVVEFVRSPITPVTQGPVPNAGIKSIRADVTRERESDNVTVAVVDTGFDPTHDPIAENVVATRDFTGMGIHSRNTQHGDGVAEIVLGVAPDADLVLVRVRSDVEFANAIRWISNHDDIDVATASLGWYGLPTDGTSFLDRQIDHSVESGTTWVTAAGNDADGQHWNGTWTTGGLNDDLLAFDETETDVVRCNRFETAGTIDITLQWDDWENPSERYGLALRRHNETTDSFETIEISNNNQRRGAPPVERIRYVPSDETLTEYCLLVGSDGATGTADFDLFVTGSELITLAHSSSSRSVVSPGTSNHALAVGAVRPSTETLVPYSARGPTIDGRVKPDIVAPTAVSTVAYGEQRFTGTSASAPHVAGAAAVVTGINETATGLTLKQRLVTTAVEPAGVERSGSPTNDVGFGMVDLVRAAPPQNPSAIRGPDTIDGSADTVPIDVVFDQPPKPGTITIQLRDESGTTVTSRSPTGTDTTTTVPTDTATLADGTITVDVTVTDSFGWQNTATTQPELTLTKNSSDGINRSHFLDRNGDGVTRSDIVSAIVAYNTGQQINGRAVTRSDIVSAIVIANTT